MGYYTTFISKEIKLRKDTPASVIEFIDKFVTHNNYDNAPLHPLFKTNRWSNLFCGNHYLKEQPYFKSEDGRYKLMVACEINHEAGEIIEFVKWISPWVTGHKPKECIGLLKKEDNRNWEPVYIERITTKLKHDQVSPF